MTEKVKEYIASLRGKKIAFVGRGVANAPSALFLARHGLQVYACDSRDESYIGKKTCEELRACGVQFSLGKDYLLYFTGDGHRFPQQRHFAVPKSLDRRMY